MVLVCMDTTPQASVVILEQTEWLRLPRRGVGVVVVSYFILMQVSEG